MKPFDLKSKVIAIARALPPEEGVPANFERRVMSAITRAVSIPFDPWNYWAGALWQAAAPCVAVAALCLLMGRIEPRLSLATELDNALLAPLIAEIDSSW